MGSAVLTNLVDTWTDGRTGYTTKNYGTTAGLNVRTGSGDWRAWIQSSRPFPLGAKIISATLRLYPRQAWASGVVVTAQRISAKWSVNRLTHANQPGVTGATAATAALGALAAGAEVAINVTALMQAVSDGSPWYGMRIIATGTANKSFYSAQSSVTKYRPVLEVVWSDAPDAPTFFSPDGNRAVVAAKPILTTNYTDVSGDQTLQAIQVQQSATANWSAPDWDSGSVTTSVPQLDLSTWTFQRSQSIGTTSGSPTISGAFTTADNGATVTRSGVPAGATMTYVSPTTATLSANATTTATSAATLDQTAPTLALNGSTYWRVRVQDGAGIWSNWSHTVNGQGAQYKRVAKPTVTINNPAASPNNFIWEPTPPMDWSVAGGTQRAYQVVIVNAAQTTVQYWNSGKITSTATVVTPAAGALKDTTITYRVIVRVWDTVDREQNGTDTPYTEVFRDFTFNYDNTVTGVSSFAGTQDSDLPSMVLTWSRASQPDGWAIYRDGLLVEEKLGSELFVSGTNYTYTDRFASPRTQHTWTVLAIVNNRQSSTNPTVVATLSLKYPILMRTDGSDAVAFLNPSRGMTKQSSQELHDPVGDAPPILITQSLKGYAGHVSGLLNAQAFPSGILAITQRDRLKRMRDDPGVELILLLVNEALRVVAYNITWSPDPTPGAVDYLAEFDYVQVVY